nr:lytic transglycosylase domain-containing protein [Cognatishimia sp. MH4019]
MASILGATPALSQGVPTQDNIAISRLFAHLEMWAKDNAVQVDKKSTAEALAKIQSDQLKALASITSATSGPSLNITQLEADPDAPVNSVYPTPNSHPMDSRLFGEGRETVEMMIVRVATEFQGAPGLARAGLSPTQWRCLFQALIKQESRFSVTAQSPVGAYGLTQLMPGTASDMGIDRYDVMDNLRGGARYITTQLNAFGNIPHALAAYNAGPGRVRQYGGIPPFKETQGYVRNITRFYNEYFAVIGGADALGTLSPSDWALAEYSNTSDASTLYAVDAFANSQIVIDRLSKIIRQIDETPDVKRAIELNTYARTEVGRILATRLRLMSATHQRQAIQNQHFTADRLAERSFKMSETLQ